jgi:hypothetical protein
MEMSEQTIEQKTEAFWRDATAEDIAKVMRGEKVEARVRDKSNENWKPSRLMGCYDTKPYSWLTIDGAFAQCQVYDPQQWWLDKPDPGEGYRLLEKFPDEPKLGTDEAWASGSFWQTVQNDNGVQEGTTWYRRRIEPENPKIPSSCDETPNSSHLGQIIEVRNYVDAAWERAELEALFPKSEFAFVARVEKNTRDFPTNWRFGRLVQAGCNSPEKSDSSRSKDYIPTGWTKLSDDEPRLASDAYWSQGASEWCLIGEDRVNFANRSKWPAIRQVETQKTMQLVLWCQYRLPNGRSIKVTKEGFELL